MEIKIKDNVILLNEELDLVETEVDDGKEIYAKFLSEIEGLFLDVLFSSDKGYTVKTPQSKKMIFVPDEYVDFVYGN